MTATPPRPDIAERECGKCGEVKAIRKGKRQCDDCNPAGDSAPKRGAKSNGGGVSRQKSGRRPKAAPDRPADSAWSRPAGLGFSVQLEVDENTKQTDIRVDQWNANAGVTQHLWLNQSEARELHSWLTEQLGV